MSSKKPRLLKEFLPNARLVQDGTLSQPLDHSTAEAVGTNGRLYLHGPATLAAWCKPAVAKHLLPLGRLHQAGDHETTVLLPLTAGPAACKVLGIRSVGHRFP